MITVIVYGPDCIRCETTDTTVNETDAKLGVAVEIQKVTDMVAIAMAGVMSPPRISVDGKLVLAGGLPDVARLEGWLSA